MGNDVALATGHNVHDGGEFSRADLRRQKIMTAAQQLFASHGFHGTGIAQIAALSGIKVGQIYRDFASKEDIVAAIVEEGINALLDGPALRQAVVSRDQAAAKRWIGDLVLRRAHPNQAPLLPEIMAEASRNARIAAVLAAADLRMRESLLSALAVFLPASAPHDRLVTSGNLIMTMMTGLCSRQMARVQSECTLLIDSILHVIDQEIERLTAAPDPADPIRPIV